MKRHLWLAGLGLLMNVATVRTGPVEDAKALLDQNKVPDAMALLDRYLQAKPTDGAAQLLLGIAQIRCGDGTKGSFTLRKAVFLDESLRAQAQAACADYLVPLAKAGRFEALPPLIDGLQKLKTPVEKVDSELLAILDLAQHQTNAPARSFAATAPSLVPGFAARHQELAEKLQQAKVKLDGLVAHYPLDGSAEDASGNGRHGKIQGEGRFVEDHLGRSKGACEFDGQGVCVDLGSNRAFHGVCTNFTICAWVRPGSRQQGGPIYVHRARQHNVLLSWSGGWVTQDNARFSFVLMYGEGKRYSVRSTEVDADRWYHVAATFDGKEMHLYVDGKDAASAAVPGPFDFNENYVGDYLGSIPNMEYRLKARLDDVRLYNRTLSGETIAALAKPGTTAAPATR